MEADGRLAVLYLCKKRSAAHIAQTHPGSCVRELKMGGEGGQSTALQLCFSGSHKCTLLHGGKRWLWI